MFRSPLALALVLSLVGGCTVDGTQNAPAAVRPADTSSLDPILVEMIEEKVAAVVAEPTSADAHGTLALVYEANELWDLADRSYDNAALLAPSDPTWIYRSARAEEETGDSTGAFDKYSDLARRFPEFAPARHQLGLRLLERGDLEGAERELQAVLERKRSLAESNAALAELRNVQGHFAEALVLADRALALDRTYLRARYLRGLALRGLGKPDEAETDLRAGLGALTQPLPDRLSGQIGLYLAGISVQAGQAADLIDRGRYDDAISILQSALALRPGDLILNNNLSVAYQRKGQPEKALEILESSYRDHPDHLPTLLNLAETYWRLRRHDDELKVAREAVRLDARSGPAHFAVAKAHLMLGDTQKGVDAAEEALRHDSDNPEIHSAAGEGLLQLNRPDLAEAHFKKAINLQSTLLPPRINLAVILISQGRLAEAEKEIKELVEMASEHPMVLRIQERYASALQAQRSGGGGSQ